MHKNHNSALYIFEVITLIVAFLLPVSICENSKLHWQDIYWIGTGLLAWKINIMSVSNFI